VVQQRTLENSVAVYLDKSQPSKQAPRGPGGIPLVLRNANVGPKLSAKIMSTCGGLVWVQESDDQGDDHVKNSACEKCSLTFVNTENSNFQTSSYFFNVGKAFKNHHEIV
jgi:hypothetical protein